MTSQANDSRWRRTPNPDTPTPARPASASLVDPEDDLPSAGYAGDFETTTIPYYQSGYATDSKSSYQSGHESSYALENVRVGNSGYGGGLQQDPPSGAQQPGGGRHSAAGPDGSGSDDVGSGEDDERVRAAGRRGTQDLGLLILRTGLAAVLLAHGLQKLFGWWGGQGLTGFKNSLSDVGYQHAEILTYVGAGGEIVAGVLLVLGLFTPLAAAGALAYLINGLVASASAQPHSRSLSYFLPHGHEYDITLIVVAIAVILIGPGRYGFDAGRGWSRRPFIGSFVVLLGGIGAGIAVWVLLNGANPLR
ncbi:DoxX family protein [Mycobacterium botniense]|uniref:DoxX family protein n=1 Tax=Mycobacterium botniense TaxID=84962 RepID=A0A7I9Y3X4_9MYCO|nr:DoxX family protein [Mycobacterium botniense]GFG76593.1 hypothetical protein MBOT_39580 [Mycobacterium botniense]